ncbi:MAG: LodA/GoxA family CTQ-dependent oxidase [Chloroflexota bacterium]
MTEDQNGAPREPETDDRARNPDDGAARVSRAEALAVAGATAAGLVDVLTLGSRATGVEARSARPRTRDTRIVRCAIFPGIGIARVGNSPTDFFIGPEVPGVSTPAGGRHKDAHGRIKRQAARFRLFGMNAAGEVVKEMTAHDADITWTVHLANKKAAWYQFKFPLDLPDAASLPPGQLTKRRNAGYRGGMRRRLVIDPGSRSIRGTGIQGPSHHFDTGTFLGRHVPLGELRTDGAGHLLVLGGFGHSGSLKDAPLRHISNNDGWYDDISDGPVTARVVVHGRSLPVTPAWVVAAPPNYAPDIVPIVTLFDIAYQASLDARPHISRPVSFTRDIYPIFERFSRMQWVSQGFYKLYGWMATDDFLAPTYLDQLAGNRAADAPLRHKVFKRFRSPWDANRVNAWPRIYGDSIFEAVTSPTHLYLTVTREQYRCLSEWVRGNFIADWQPGRRMPRTLEEIPLPSRPGALNRAGLDACSGGPFHPGEEVPWIMRNASLYTELCRLRVRSPKDRAEPDYGEVLTPHAAMGPRGPLHRSGPGDITRWMAVPWQTDTANCGAGYRGTTSSQPAGDLPTFWPAVVPNRVLTERVYEQIVKKERSTSARQASFRQRASWARHLPPEGLNPGENAPRNRAFVASWPRLGIVVERPGPADPSLPGVMYVETESGFREDR